jgi:hypothetical protein
MEKADDDEGAFLYAAGLPPDCRRITTGLGEDAALSTLPIDVGATA